MEKFDHLFIQPNDFSKSIFFFTEVLGWKVKQAFGEAKDAGRLAYLTFGDFTLILAEDHDFTTDPMTKPKFYNVKNRVSLHFSTPDVDASFAKIKSGDHVVRSPENTHWGTRWFLVEDPDGNQFGWQGPAKP